MNDQEYADHRKRMDEMARKNSEEWNLRKQAEVARAEQVRARLLETLGAK